MPDKREALSIKECILVLSKMTVECTSGLEHDYGDCAAGCQDGYVPRFPQLQEYVRACKKCAWAYGNKGTWCGHPDCDPKGSHRCPYCLGTGYIVTEPPIRVAFEISREILRDVSAEWLATYKPWEKHMSCPPDLYWNAVLEVAGEEQDAHN